MRQHGQMAVRLKGSSSLSNSRRLINRVIYENPDKIFCLIVYVIVIGSQEGNIYEWSFQFFFKKFVS